jgi:hypothetical protein
MDRNAANFAQKMSIIVISKLVNGLFGSWRKVSGTKHRTGSSQLRRERSRSAAAVNDALQGAAIGHSSFDRKAVLNLPERIKLEITGWALSCRDKGG